MRKSAAVLFFNLFFFCCMAEVGFPPGKYEISEEGRRNAEFMQESSMFYYYIRKKDNKQAVRYFQTILEKKPQSEYLVYWGIQLYKQGLLSEEKLIDIASRHPESPILCGSFAEVLEEKGKTKIARELVEKSFSYYLDPPSETEDPRGKDPGVFPDKFQILIETYLALMEREKNFQQGDKMLEKFLRFFPFKKLTEGTLINLIKYSILAEKHKKTPERTKRTDLYLKTLKEKLNAPNEFREEIPGIFVALLLDRNEIELAEALLTEHLLTEPYTENSFRNLLLLYTMKNQKQNMIRALAHEIVLSTMKAKRIPGKLLAMLLSTAFDAENETEIKMNTDRVIRLGFLDDNLCCKAVSYYLSKKDFTKARFFCSKVKNGSTRDLLTGHILSKEGKYKQALAIFLRLEQKNPRNSFFKMLAAENAGKAGELEIEKQFRNEMILKSETEPDFQNFLGYTWAEQGINLKQAEEYISSALKQEPLNSAYLDSMAWVLYRKKDYRQAKEYILRALNLCKEPESRGVLLDHAGDIFSALGMKRIALKYWQMAVQTESNELDINSVLKKLPRPEVVPVKKVQNPAAEAGDRKTGPAVSETKSF